jgi:hypothetical protein
MKHMGLLAARFGADAMLGGQCLEKDKGKLLPVVVDTTKQTSCSSTDHGGDLRRAKWGSGIKLHGSNPEPKVHLRPKAEEFFL